MRLVPTRPAAFAGVTLISFAAIFVRLADVSPTTMTFWRSAYAVPMLALVWLAFRRKDGRPIRSRLIAFGAGLLLAADLTAWHIAIEDIGAGLATVLVNTQVVFVGLLAWLLHKERPAAVSFKLIPVIFTGAVLISGLGRADAYGDSPERGVLLGVLGGLFYGLFILTLRASNKAHVAPSSGPMLDATIGTLVGGLIAGAFASDFSLSVDWPAHGWIVLLALTGQTVGWLLIANALPRLPALETSVMILAQPMMTVIWALIIFDESLSVVQWAGVAIVLIGLLVLTVKGTVAPDAARVHRSDDTPVATA